jgi:hypothetical protein
MINLDPSQAILHIPLGAECKDGNTDGANVVSVLLKCDEFHIIIKHSNAKEVFGSFEGFELRLFRLRESLSSIYLNCDWTGCETIKTG